MSEMRELFGLEGKRILVLGGGQGMGEATSRLLAKVGAKVAIVDREMDRAERVAAEIGSQVEAAPFCFDVLDDDALVGGIAGIQKDFGPLDGMATIIGMAGWGSILDAGPDEWDLDHRRNLRFFYLAAREVARSLIERGAPGAIVGTASVDGKRCAPFHASYGAAKAGMINLAKTMAVEWGSAGIRANIVAPGPIITPRIPHRGEEEAAMNRRTPMLRRGEVDEIASAIVFFLSDMARFVTGQTLAVDGGFLAQYPSDLLGAQGTRGTMGTNKN